MKESFGQKMARLRKEKNQVPNQQEQIPTKEQDSYPELDDEVTFVEKESITPGSWNELPPDSSMGIAIAKSVAFNVVLKDLTDKLESLLILTDSYDRPAKHLKRIAKELADLGLFDEAAKIKISAEQLINFKYVTKKIEDLFSSLRNSMTY